MQILLENSDINSGKQSLGRFHKIVHELDLENWIQFE